MLGENQDIESMASDRSDHPSPRSGRPAGRLGDSQVVAHLNAMHCWPDPQSLTGQWNWVQHKDIQDRRLTAFGFAVREVDGHDPAAVESALSLLPFEPDKPSCLIAHTVKGKGVSFMEDRLLWHYRSPQGEEYERAIAELGGEP